MKTRRSFIKCLFGFVGLGGISQGAKGFVPTRNDFIIPLGWDIIQGKRSGWYVVDTEHWQRLLLHKDLTLNIGTGWCYHEYGEAPGFWPTKEAARDAIWQYQRKLKKQDREFPSCTDWTCFTEVNCHQPSLQGKIRFINFKDKTITVRIDSYREHTKSPPNLTKYKVKK